MSLLKTLLIGPSSISGAKNPLDIITLAHAATLLPAGDAIIMPHRKHFPMLFELREHDHSAAYNPVITFSKSSFSVLRCYTNNPSIGTGLVFRNFTRSEIDGGTIKVMSRATKTQDVMVNSILIYDGHYDRESFIDFPDNGGMAIKGAGLLQTIANHVGNYAWTEDSAVLDLSAGTETECCLMMKIGDGWSARNGYFELDWVKYYDSEGTFIAWEDFLDSVHMEVTGTVHDYGYISMGGP